MKFYKNHCNCSPIRNTVSPSITDFLRLDVCMCMYIHIPSTSFLLYHNYMLITLIEIVTKPTVVHLFLSSTGTSYLVMSGSIFKVYSILIPPVDFSFAVPFRY